MASTALSIVLRSVCDDQRYFDGIAQTNQPIRQLRASIKGLDLVPQVAQFANRARQAVRASDQPDVVPHDVLNRLHVALDQRRIGFRTQATLVPWWNVSLRRSLVVCGVVERSFDLNRRPIAPDQAFQ